MIDDSNDYLKSLIIKLLSIISYSIICKKTFSILGFLYGKRKQSLNLSIIKIIIKI